MKQELPSGYESCTSRRHSKPSQMLSPRRHTAERKNDPRYAIARVLALSIGRHLKASMSKQAHRLALSVACLFSCIGAVHSEPQDGLISPHSSYQVGEISLGCVPRARSFVVYLRSDETPVLNQESIDRFPVGFEQLAEEQGNFSFIVDSIVRANVGQMLIGHLMDGRGRVMARETLVFSSMWRCTLYTQPNDGSQNQPNK